MKGIGSNPKNEGKKKRGLKVHMLIDAHSQTPTFVKISEARSHDKNFIQYLKLAPHSIFVFDRAIIITFNLQDLPKSKSILYAA